MTNYQALKKINKIINKNTKNYKNLDKNLKHALISVNDIIVTQKKRYQNQKIDEKKYKNKLEKVVNNIKVNADCVGCDDIACEYGDSIDDFTSNFYLVKNYMSNKWSWLYIINTDEEYYTAKITSTQCDETGDECEGAEKAQDELNNDIQLQHLLNYLNQKLSKNRDKYYNHKILIDLN